MTTRLGNSNNNDININKNNNKNNSSSSSSGDGDDGYLGAATISDSGAEVDIVPIEVAEQLVAANVVGPIQALPVGEQMVITFGKAGSKEAVVGEAVAAVAAVVPSLRGAAPDGAAVPYLD